MAYKLQVTDLKRSTVRNIAGICVDSPGFLELANEVQRRILRRGGWFDTEWLVKLCFTNGCVVWPRYVSAILGARGCNGNLTDAKNRWYSILGGATGLNRSGGYGYGGIGSYGGWDGPYTGWGDVVLADNGTAATYNQISGNTGKLLRYYTTYRADVGKTITIYGKKYGGQPLQHYNATTGAYEDGLVLTAAVPFGTSSVLVTQIDSVVREATQGNSWLYEYDSNTDLLRDLALYEPNETNPRYRASKVMNWCGLSGCAKTTTVDDVDYQTKQASLECLVKLAHFDLVNDNDFLLIDNLDAFKFGFQAVKLEEMNDEQGAEIKWMKAVRELNLELREKNPDGQIPVYVNVVNGHEICSLI